jgi:(p)ppGpp synthase/HD superfamily hydrolase
MQHLINSLSEQQDKLFAHDLVKNAWIYAKAAHGAIGQIRRYTNDAYIIHPYNVALLVANTTNATPEMVAAAFLHDVVEDTKITPTDINDTFGTYVTALVLYLTDNKIGQGNRAARKALDRARLAAAPAAVQTIKYADLIHNAESIFAYDKNFSVTYFREMRELLAVMPEGDPELYERAVANCETLTKQLQEERLQSSLHHHDKRY